MITGPVLIPVTPSSVIAVNALVSSLTKSCKRPQENLPKNPLPIPMPSVELTLTVTLLRVVLIPTVDPIPYASPLIFLALCTLYILSRKEVPIPTVVIPIGLSYDVKPVSYTHLTLPTITGV